MLGVIMKTIFPPQEDFIRWRRQVHKHAEPGFGEFWTTYFVYSLLKDLPVRIHLGKDIYDRSKMFGTLSAEEKLHWQEEAAKNGVPREELALFEGVTGLAVDIMPVNREDAQIRTLFRFDLDAVPVQEKQDQGHAPFELGFSSVNNGYCHACGHDGHVAVGIGLVKVLASMRQELDYGIRVVFQPAEEGVRGAYGLKHLCAGVQYAVIGHIGMSAVKSRSIVCGSEGFFATKKLKVYFHGKSAHAGGEPEKGRNALLGACCAVMNLHAMPRYGKGDTRINVGILHAGSSANVIAEYAEFAAEIRGINSDVCDDLAKRAENIIASAASMYDLEYRIEFTGMCDSASSDEDLARFIVEKAGEIPYFEQENCLPAGKGFGSDDACTFMRAVQEQGGKAVYCMIGSRLKAGHHSPDFDFEESLLRPFCELFVNTALALDKKTV